MEQSTAIPLRYAAIALHGDGLSIKRPVSSQEIVKVALENGINMFDEAETYAKGKSELELYVCVRP